MVKKPDWEGELTRQNYELDTEEREQRVDTLFRMAVQDRTILAPNNDAQTPLDPKLPTGGDTTEPFKVPSKIEVLDDAETPLDRKLDSNCVDLENSNDDPPSDLEISNAYHRYRTQKQDLHERSPTPTNDTQKFYKIFIMVSDEREGPGATGRATTVYVQDVKQEANCVTVQTRELIQELQHSSQAIVGSARLSVSFTINGLVLRTSFYLLRAGAEYLGPGDIPELLVASADPQTMCDYTLHIFLDTIPELKEKIDSVKRHFTSLSLDDEDEKDSKKPKHSTSKLLAKPKPIPAQRDPVQLLWLEKHYKNVISEALGVQVTRKASSTCSLSCFCAYIYIVSHLTPGDDCDPAGRFPITNNVLKQFLGVTTDWIGQAKKAGSLQILGSHIPAIRAHMDGEIVEYLGIKPWTEFLEKAISMDKVKIEVAVE
ncbi:hypothetical protein C8R44DRAFT_744577 [Mycena epipterygia]|nr:hypothetical protein C8R44DRAFT_744577 [Mycena epipterygia]